MLQICKIWNHIYARVYFYVCTSTLCPKNLPTFLVFEQRCQKLTDFNDFWYAKSRRRRDQSV